MFRYSVLAVRFSLVCICSALSPTAGAQSACIEYEVVTAPFQTIDTVWTRFVGVAGTCVDYRFNKLIKNEHSYALPAGIPLSVPALNGVIVHKCGGAFLPSTQEATSSFGLCPEEADGEINCHRQQAMSSVDQNGLLTITYDMTFQADIIASCDGYPRLDGPRRIRQHGEHHESWRIDLHTGIGSQTLRSQHSLTWNMLGSAWVYKNVQDSWSHPAHSRRWTLRHKADSEVALRIQVLTPRWHVNPGVPVQQIAVDHISEARVRITAPSADPIHLELRMDGLSVADGSAGRLLSSTVIPRRVSAGRYEAETTYFPPFDISRSKAARPVVTIATTGLPVNVVSRITLAAPPVLTFHGVWSDALAWSDLRPYLVRKYPADVILGGYDTLKARSFADPVMRGVIRQNFDAARRQLLARGVLATRFDVVAHSMGALAVLSAASDNAYYRAENNRRGDVLRLISVGSPMAGSELASFLTLNKEATVDGFPAVILRVVGKGCPTGTLKAYMGCLGNALTCGAERCAVDALAVGSPELSDLSTIRGTPILGVTTTAPGSSVTEDILDAIIDAYDDAPRPPSIDSMLQPSGPEHDVIVGVRSQNSLANRIFLVEDVLHASPVSPNTQTRNPRVYSAVLCHLRSQSSCSTAAKATSYDEPDLLAAIESRTETAPSEVALQPAAGTMIAIGDGSPIAMSAMSGSIERVYVLNDDGSIELREGEDASFVEIMATNTNAASIHAVVLLSGNRFAVVNADFPVDSETPDSLMTDQGSAELQLGVGDAAVPAISAVFGQAGVSVTEDVGIDVATGEEFIRIDVDAKAIVGVAAGRALVRYTYRGVSVDLVVSVTEPPAVAEHVFGDSFE